MLNTPLELKICKVILIIVIAILTLFFSEVGGYIWHRFGAHTDLIPPVRETHRDHHISDLTHDAQEDFYWIILMLFGLALIFIFLTYYGIPWYITTTIYAMIVLSYTWTWYIHSAYHIKNHWLEKYDWFLEDRELHFQHHEDPHSNYTIATHFPDKIFGTYQESINDLSLDRPWETQKLNHYTHLNLN